MKLAQNIMLGSTKTMSIVFSCCLLVFLLAPLAIIVSYWKSASLVLFGA